MGSILDELFLLVIHGCIPFHGCLYGRIQDFEFFHLGFVYQWSRLFSGAVFFQPFNERIKGAEAGFEYKVRYQQDTTKQADI